MNKKTIFVFIYGYLPGENYGGPVTSIYNLVERFHEKYDFRIVCSNHDHGSRETYSGISDGWNKVGNANVWYLDESEYREPVFEKIIQGFEINLFYLTGVFSYKLNHSAICVARKNRIPVLIATRGEICRNVLAMKSYKKLPYLWVMKNVHEYRDVLFQVTSEEEREQLKKYLSISEDRIYMLPNLHSACLNCEREKNVSRLKLLFVSRIHPKKNLLDAVKAVIAVKTPVDFDIFGPIEDEEYWKECAELINQAPANVKIQYCGKLTPKEAKEVYLGYDFFLFPTLTENYGHVIVESMLANCPVIISRGTTPWDDLDGRAGKVVGLHDIEALTSSIEECAKMSREEYKELVDKLIMYRDEKLCTDLIVDGYEIVFSLNDGRGNSVE